jgi:hypothetical protein
VTEETNAYTEKLATLETAITALENELEGKAASGGGVATCTIEIVNETIGTWLESRLDSLWFIAYESGEYKKYGGRDGSESNKLPSDFDWQAEKITLNNVVCGSMMYLTDIQSTLIPPQDWFINAEADSCYLFVPATPDAIHTLKMISF